MNINIILTEAKKMKSTKNTYLFKKDKNLLERAFLQSGRIKRLPSRI